MNMIPNPFDAHPASSTDVYWMESMASLMQTTFDSLQRSYRELQKMKVILKKEEAAVTKPILDVMRSSNAAGKYVAIFNPYSISTSFVRLSSKPRVTFVADADFDQLTPDEQDKAVRLIRSNNHYAKILCQIDYDRLVAVALTVDQKDYAAGTPQRVVTNRAHDMASQKQKKAEREAIHIEAKTLSYDAKAAAAMSTQPKIAMRGGRITIPNRMLTGLATQQPSFINTPKHPEFGPIRRYTEFNKIGPTLSRINDYLMSVGVDPISIGLWANYPDQWMKTTCVTAINYSKTAAFIYHSSIRVRRHSKVVFCDGTHRHIEIPFSDLIGMSNDQIQQRIGNMFT